MSADRPDPGQPKHDSAANSLPLAEEQVRISKRENVTGRLRLRTETDEVEEVVSEALRSVRADVERVPMDVVLDDGVAPPRPRTEGDVTIVPILEEVLVIQKRLVLKEEVHVRLHSGTEETRVPVTLRRQRAVIERDAPEKED